jgi:hypothetical protein
MKITPKLCASGVTLRNQINKNYPKRDKTSDGWIGDAKHVNTKSDHNPDKNGIVRAIDIDSNLGKNINSAELAEQLRLCAKNGDERISYIIHNKKIASKILNWRWRKYTGSNPHVSHIHVSFTNKGDLDKSKFNLISSNAISEQDQELKNAKDKYDKLLLEFIRIGLEMTELKQKYKF